MSAPTHTYAHKRHTHGDTQTRTPCGHAFFCLPVSNKKKRFKEEVKGGVLKGGEGRQREEDLSALMDEVNTCCVLCRYVFERQSSLSQRETGREGRVNTVWDKKTGSLYATTFSWSSDNNVQSNLH